MTKQRSDSVGIFWQDYPVETGGRVERVRPLPPIPDTGWTPPNEFPDLSAANMLSFDVETKDQGLAEGNGPGVRRDDSFICGLSVGTDDGYRAYFPMRHLHGGNLDPDMVLRWAADTLGNPKQTKIGMNLMYDLDWLAEEGVEVKADRFIDIGVAEPLIDENQYSFSMENMAQKYLGEGKVAEAMYEWTARAYGGAATRKAQAGNIWRAPVELAGPYGESDADLPFRIYAKQRPILEQQELIPVFDMESDLIPVLLMMRRHGVRINTERAAEVGVIMEQRTVEFQAQLDTFVGFHCNVWSNADVAQAFDKFSLPYPKTPNGGPSFVKDWLEHNPEPLAQMILDVRKWSKAKATFIDGHIMGHLVGDRLHSEFHQLKTDDNGAVSGRLSSSNPNLQNLPSRDEELAALVRSLFIPDEGYQWMRYDWSQIEYRFLAHYARGPSGTDVRDAYLNDPTTDFHERAYYQILEKTGNDLGRKAVKAINFGLTYGMGKPKITRTLGLTQAAGYEFFESYHNSVPFVKATFEYAAQIAANRGYVKTIMGRRRRFHLWEPAKYYSDSDKYKLINSGAVPEDYFKLVRTQEEAVEKWGPKVKRAGTHKSLNAVMQGGAAELMKKSMVDQYKAGVYSVIGPPLLTVHDELGLNGNKSKASREAHREAKHIMETSIKLKVPIMVDVEVGPNWGTLSNITEGDNHEYI